MQSKIFVTIHHSKLHIPCKVIRMKVLIFDTETTGLPKNFKIPAIVQPNNWPHLVSISWVILDVATNLIIKQRDYIVKPYNWIIPEDSTKIHRITDVYATLNGFLLKDVMAEFMSEQCDVLVSHNLNFDRNVVINAIQWDLNIPFTGFIPKIFHCTMLNSEHIFGKWPKLSELFEYIFKRKPSYNNLHGSLYDTLLVVQCIQQCEWLRSTMDLPPIRSLPTNELQ